MIGQSLQTPILWMPQDCKLEDSESWIEQVKAQAMAGATRTDNFWANDILWQLSVYA
jgi:hypothetical protein